MEYVAAAARATVHAQSAASVTGRDRCEAAYVCVAVRDLRRDLSAMPVADWLMANHPVQALGELRALALAQAAEGLAR